ncbi:uncharacterized protein F4822DRAFT_434114 [Hypoxylon trugodes]|uniref:uncharacterized protein n=1 Tax=Hypoxylon trugodes TaxID=326681 RepID=UPI00218D7BCB|nr:uncharacterized protein F4822DRAFT_434114 [Hypoxylon trugodes]KAI1384174.1 hypothetical protein F4822DRAFT_434114 [Hypoxylon trugodes]
MQQAFSGGLPVNGQSFEDEDQQKTRNSATQSTGTPAEPKQDSERYILSPSTQIGDLGYQFPAPINTTVQGYQNTLHSASSSHGAWPTPPSTCDNSFSPTSDPGGASSAGPHSSVPSPGNWSPNEFHRLNFQQLSLRESDQMPAYGFRSCPSLQYEQQQLHPQMGTTSYESTGFTGTGLDASNMVHQEVPSTITGFPGTGPAAASRSESPQQTRDADISYGSYNMEVDEASVQPESMDQGSGEDGAKIDEPYAVLIHRALMSVTPHQMMLQQIYQWFRENTNKGKSSGKGWQNSIRHNLSMNHAFVRHEGRSSDSVTEAGESKKASVWVLEPWAVGGVQSTTRYRSKPTSSRRGGGAGHHGRGIHARLSGRAHSGRKGGQSASRSKAAAMRRAMGHRRSLSAGFIEMGESMHNQVQNMLFNQRVGLQPLTPPDVSHDMILAHSMHNPVLPTNDASHHGFTFPQYQGAQQQPHHTHPTHPVYMEDVTGMYHGHQAPAPVQGGQGGQGLPASMAPDLNGLFEENPGNTDRNNRNPDPFQYWDDQTQGGPPYQP